MAIELEHILFRLHTRVSRWFAAVFDASARKFIEVLLIVMCITLLIAFGLLHLQYVGRTQSCLANRLSEAIDAAGGVEGLHLMRVRVVSPQVAASDRLRTLLQEEALRGLVLEELAAHPQRYALGSGYDDDAALQQQQQQPVGGSSTGGGFDSDGTDTAEMQLLRAVSRHLLAKARWAAAAKEEEADAAAGELSTPLARRRQQWVGEQGPAGRGHRRRQRRGGKWRPRRRPGSATSSDGSGSRSSDADGSGATGVSSPTKGDAVAAAYKQVLLSLTDVLGALRALAAQQQQAPDVAPTVAVAADGSSPAPLPLPARRTAAVVAAAKSLLGSIFTLPGRARAGPAEAAAPGDEATSGAPTDADYEAAVDAAAAAIAGDTTGGSGGNGSVSRRLSALFASLLGGNDTGDGVNAAAGAATNEPGSQSSAPPSASTAGGSSLSVPSKQLIHLYSAVLRDLVEGTLATSAHDSRSDAGDAALRHRHALLPSTTGRRVICVPQLSRARTAAIASALPAFHWRSEALAAAGMEQLHADHSMTLVLAAVTGYSVTVEAPARAAPDGRVDGNATSMCTAVHVAVADELMQRHRESFALMQHGHAAGHSGASAGLDRDDEGWSADGVRIGFLMFPGDEHDDSGDESPCSSDDESSGACEPVQRDETSCGWPGGAGRASDSSCIAPSSQSSGATAQPPRLLAPRLHPLTSVPSPLRRSDEPVFTFSGDKGLLAVAPAKRDALRVSLLAVDVDTEGECLGPAWSRWLLESFVGYDTVVVNAILAAVGGVGHIRLDHTGENVALSHATEVQRFNAGIESILLFKLGTLCSAAFLLFAASSLVSYLLAQTQQRMFRFTVQLQDHVLHHLPLLPLVAAHLFESLVFVPIMLGVLLFLFELFGDQLLAFLVLLTVWACELWSITSCRTVGSLRVFPRVFGMLMTWFLVYHLSYPFGYQYLALAVVGLGLTTTAFHLWSKYELPALQTGLITTRQPRAPLVASIMNLEGRGGAVFYGRPPPPPPAPLAPPVGGQQPHGHAPITPGESLHTLPYPRIHAPQASAATASLGAAASGVTSPVTTASAQRYSITGTAAAATIASLTGGATASLSVPLCVATATATGVAPAGAGATNAAGAAASPQLPAHSLPADDGAATSSLLGLDLDDASALGPVPSAARRARSRLNVLAASGSASPVPTVPGGAASSPAGSAADAAAPAGRGPAPSAAATAATGGGTPPGDAPAATAAPGAAALPQPGSHAAADGSFFDGWSGGRGGGGGGSRSAWTW